MTSLVEPPAPATAKGPPAGPAYVALIALSVGLAFADASIVVLALPDLYGAFGVSIVEVSWVITSYNVAVVATSVALLAVRAGSRRLTAVGSAVFAASSVVCGVAPSFAVLVAGRSAQGVGAACLLVGSLPLLAAVTGSGSRARAVWGYAGAVGVAVGPALGGVLTQLVSWRSIFLVQAPVAALALGASLRVRRGATDAEDRGRVGLRAGLAGLGFVALFASLVGALFLSVLLFIVVWAYSPLQGAAVVSLLAVGAVAIGPVGRCVPRWLAALGGGWMLGGGLLVLAWVPEVDAGYAAAALGLCGCGFGLLNAVLDRPSLPDEAGLHLPGNVVIGAKHIGFVLGLVLVSPALAGDLAAATRSATASSAAIILDAPLELRVKVPLALDMKNLVQDARRGEVPDLAAPFDKRAGSGPAVVKVRDDVGGAVESTITRAFRTSFVTAAVFAGLAAAVGLGLALTRDER